MSRACSLLAVSLCLWSAAHAAPWADDFTRPRRYERWGVDCWQLGGGQAAFKGGGDNSFLIATGPTAREVTLEADLTLTSRTGSSWAVAGLSLFRDAMNHWRLLLVEGPTGDHYFEFIEMYSGQHQAQNGGDSPRTYLEGTTTGVLKEWAWNKPYHLTLKLTADAISGTVADPATGAVWERSFSFARGLAVKSGHPGLMSSEMAGAFARLTVNAATPPTEATMPLQTGARGTIALVPDLGNAIAPRLAEKLRGAGYGVTMIPWEQLDRLLPWDKLDLVVLADARRVPAAAQDMVAEAVACGGKVMCLGAPAFGTMLAKAPDGWLPPEAWLQSYAKGLPHRPIVVAPDGWTRQSSDGDLPGGVVADPAAGATAWRVDSTLKGWDTWRADVTKPLDETHRLLTFQAKGDATTSQLSIELDEADGSRWIALVDLATEWKTFVLPASAFQYWYDSKAKNRGGPGDRLRPENVTALIFGLASSHTRAVKPGPHTYWLRDLAGAEGQDVPEPGSFALEALCPSYKLYPLDEVAQVRPVAAQGVTQVKATAWKQPGYAPVWREQGRGLHRRRPWRWLPILEAVDAKGRTRGALVSLMLGNTVHPNAVWANVAVREPAQALDPTLAPVMLDTLNAMARGCFLVEGGAELFSYKPGEAAVVGGQAINLGRQAQTLALRCVVKDGKGNTCFDQQKTLAADPQVVVEASWDWKPTFAVPGGYEIATTLASGGAVIDRIVHRIEPTRVTPAKPEEFVRVEGSNFTLGGKPWYFKGVNYWGNWIAGYPNLNVYQRPNYDPEIIERDLTQLQAMGVNALSAVQALVPPDPDDPKAFRDQRDFLDRCDRHGMKVFFFLHGGRPYAGGSYANIQNCIARAGIKDHPAIMCWELAWEPIDTPWQGRLDAMRPDWNRWIVQRYGSTANAFTDWGFTPKLTEDGLVPIPEVSQCQTHGEWDRYVAAFRRAHSDLISAAYRDIAEPLRQWDPQHLVSFRGGACGIPWSANFAHLHSAGAAKHMDFLNPEGYNLQTSGHGTPTPPDEIRKGGLVTLLCRAASREKPIVWMEFGYTVNGINTDWRPELVHLKPEQLQNQADELRNFYSMFQESGARGAAPWWWPGGFRLGENSDFGLCEPDGTERPACDVLRRMLPRFAQVQHPQPTDFITLDFETHGPDSWPLYSQQYLDLVKAGKTATVKTAGTGTTSADCPLTAVGGGPYNGHNPPVFLNAEFNRLELKVGEGAWQAVQDGQTIEAPAGAKLLCRASVGNLGEAKWLAPNAIGGQPREGSIFLAGRQEYGLAFEAPVAAATDYLGDAMIQEFVLLPAVAAGEQRVSFEMESRGRAYFGERRTITIKGR